MFFKVIQFYCFVYGFYFGQCVVNLLGEWNYTKEIAQNSEDILTLLYYYLLCQIVSAKFVGCCDILKIVLILRCFCGIMNCHINAIKMCEKRIKTATFFRKIVINLIKCWCTYEGKIYLLQICKRCD